MHACFLPALYIKTCYFTGSDEHLQNTDFVRSILRNPHVIPWIRTLEIGLRRPPPHPLTPGDMPDQIENFVYMNRDARRTRNLSDSDTAHEIKSNDWANTEFVERTLTIGPDWDGFKDAWISGLQESSADAFIALIISACSSGLRSLNVEFPLFPTCFRRVIDYADFDQLESVTIFPQSPRTLTSTDVMPFFRLPSLKSFTAYFLIETKSICSYRDSPVTHLQLYSCIGRYGMHDLICRCKALKSFQYSYWNVNMAGCARPQLAPCPHAPTPTLDIFARTLEHAISTLETVHFEHNAICGHGEPDRELVLGSLAGFPNIKRLRIHAYHMPKLYHFQPSLHGVLPPSLETLEITECLDTSLYFMVKAMTHLVVPCKKVPSLSRIILRVQFTSLMPDFHEDYQRIQVIGAASSRQGSISKSTA
ncbi:hypothetical protein FQN49_002169 [Arthroderma sp. PD_2]|nr:hypothetical protein FQN49_002169 [Arthroderma sp. PD_2]